LFSIADVHVKLKKRVLALIAILILSTTILLTSYAQQVEVKQIIALEESEPEDVNNGSTYIIANGTYVLNETIIIEEYGKLIIENANVTFDTTDYIVIRSYDNSIVTITNSEIEHAQGSQLHSTNFSTVLITNSTVDVLINYDSANTSITGSMFDIVHGYGSSLVSINDTEIRFVGAHDTSSVSVANSRVDEVHSASAKVSVDNCTVKSLVDAYGSSIVTVANSRVNQVCVYGFSVVSVDDSVADRIVATASTFVSIVNSTVKWFSPRKALIDNSTLSEINLCFYEDANVSLSYLPIGLIDYWNLFENNTVVSAPYYWNPSESITIKNSQIYGWDIEGYGSPIISVMKSKINDVVAWISSFISLINSEIVNSVTIHSQSTVLLVNSTLQGDINILPYGEWEKEITTKGIVGWYLDTKVTDINGSPFLGLLVEAYWQNGTMLVNAITDRDGRTRFILYEKLVNLTGTFTYTNYTVKVSYSGYTNETVIGIITRNMEITMTLPVILGDINNDRIVNIKDVAIVAKAYGSEPEDPNWNEAADLDSNEIINILDIVIVAKAYGNKEGDPDWNPIADVAEPYGEIDIVDIATVAKDYGKTV